jgi:hypothetical protein
MPETAEFNPTPRFAICHLCNEPVELETSKTDEDGKAVHEDCYLRNIRVKQSTTPSKS